jgi:hypothetical protein
LSKLNVGVGADFPVDSAEPSPSDDERYEDCAYRHFRGRHGFRGRHRWRGGRFFYFGPLALIAFIAMISLAISYPGIILALFAFAALAFAMRHHRWHEYYDAPDGRDGYDPRDRDDYDRGPRDPNGVGPQPDAGPTTSAPGRS